MPQRCGRANRAAVEFAAGLRDQYASNEGPIVINGLIGPRGDAYAPDQEIAAKEAQVYHSEQLGWLAETDVDMVTALTFTQADEAIGVVRAAEELGLPVVVSFTVETDGNLPYRTTASGRHPSPWTMRPIVPLRTSWSTALTQTTSLD